MLARNSWRRALSTAAAAEISRGATRRWPRRVGRFLLGTTVVGGAVYVVDRQYQASAIARSIRTLSMGLIVSLDYKLNFNVENVEGIDALHARSAERLYDCITKNGGLYIKLGQAIGLQAAMLPPPYRRAFANIFDQAPTVPYSEVEQIFAKEFNGMSPDDLFDSFDRTPIASASIAQVHRARLNGQEVAVKVQKMAIAKQIEWDLWCYRVLLKMADWWFEMPIAFLSSYISEQITHETDFEREARNSTRAAKDFATDPWLAARVYVPKVNWDRTSRRVMTAEWIGDAHRLNDGEAIVRRGFNTKSIMDTVISALSAQTFVFGFVHCDPHPGNILIRPHPADKTKPQVVLIDHGLYVELPDKFRREYAELWRSIFVGDIRAVERTAKLWGIDPGSGDLFASSILLRPHRLKPKPRKPSEGKDGEEEKQLTPEEYKALMFQQQEAMKKRVKTFLQNEELIPRELIFIGRVQRMLQGNNQVLGSPSNRVNLTAKWSAIGCRVSLPPVSSIFTLGPKPLLSGIFELIVFRLSLSLIDLAFRFTRLQQWWRGQSSRRGSGFEDLLDRQVRDMARHQLGVDMDDESLDVLIQS
ncbi:ABC1-domain-containing protein [Exidia glandulosa HHB12029]|uniref:ABC1-domain-containing protein n=1 Tax=Exidia glandulosa HHB12029 TaxID=1314781 RepID=A0A165L805_EXIGL|nr:ABC1-domain-containing protein [Exidia glandulosa HHB12029]